MADPIAIILSVEDENKLTAIINKGTHNSRVVKRAEILLRLTEGLSCRAIADIVNRHYNTVNSIRKKYELGGIQEALYDAPRSGAPRKIYSEHEAVITTLACSEPPKGHDRWTLELLSDRVVQLTDLESIGKETVRRVLKKSTKTVAESTMVHRKN